MWVKLDDQFSDHPKVMAAGPLASWLFVCGLNYAARLLTDGAIPASQVRKLADVDDPAALAAKLVAVGLWEPTEAGYMIHDYLDYNPSREKVLSTRASRAEAGSKGGKQKSSNLLGKRLDVATDNVVAKSYPVPAPVPVPVSDPHPDPDPAPTLDPFPDDDDHTGAGESAPAREDNRGVLLEFPNGAPDADTENKRRAFHDRSWRWFCESYGKAVPAGLRDRWPSYCPDPATFAQIREGLPYWRKCRTWVQDGPDYVTKPETWLADKLYLEHPLPWQPEEGKRDGGTTQSGRRAENHATSRRDRERAAEAERDAWFAANAGIVTGRKLVAGE